MTRFYDSPPYKSVSPANHSKGNTIHNERRYKPPEQASLHDISRILVKNFPAQQGYLWARQGPLIPSVPMNCNLSFIDKVPSSRQGENDGEPTIWFMLCPTPLFVALFTAIQTLMLGRVFALCMSFIILGCCCDSFLLQKSPPEADSSQAET